MKIFQNNPKIKEEITHTHIKIRQYLKTNGNKKITSKFNKCSKISVQKEILALNAYTRKAKISKINHLNFYFKKLGKEEQSMHQAGRRKNNKD